MEQIEIYNTIIDQKERNPIKLAKVITELSKNLKENRKEIEKIKERNVFERLVNNNTRDLALLIIKQNDITSHLFIMFKILLEFSLRNTSSVSELYSELNKISELQENNENEFFEMAKSYVGECNKAAKRYNISVFVFVMYVLISIVLFYYIFSKV